MGNTEFQNHHINLGGYKNLGVSAALILVADVSKRLAAGRSGVAKEKTQSKIVSECKIPCSSKKPLSPNPVYNSSNLSSTNIAESEIQDTSPMQYMQLPPMMDGSNFDRMMVKEIKQQADNHISDASREVKEKVAQ